MDSESSGVQLRSMKKSNTASCICYVRTWGKIWSDSVILRTILKINSSKQIFNFSRGFRRIACFGWISNGIPNQLIYREKLSLGWISNATISFEVLFGPVHLQCKFFLGKEGIVMIINGICLLLFIFITIVFLSFNKRRWNPCEWSSTQGHI